MAYSRQFASVGWSIVPSTSVSQKQLEENLFCSFVPQKMWEKCTFHTFGKFLQIYSLTVHIASLGCLLSAIENWTSLNHSKGIPWAPIWTHSMRKMTIFTPLNHSKGSPVAGCGWPIGEKWTFDIFCKFSQNLLSNFLLFSCILFPYDVIY